MAPQTRSRAGATEPIATDSAVPKSQPMAARKRARRAGPVAKNVSNPAPDSRTFPFTDLPLELFTEIAKYLQPLDIVLLARVNKLFRGILMHRSATPVWRAVQRNVKDLPPCPENFSEPQYAALVFLEECSTCSEPTPDGLYPILQVRLCTGCRKERLVEAHPFKKDLLFVDNITTPSYYGTWCFASDAEAVKTKRRELKAAGDQEEMRRWVKERRTLVKERDRIARPLYKWIRATEREREQELTRLKEARQAEIEARLKKLDWEPADFDQIDYKRKEKWRSLVYIAEPLDDKKWGKLLPVLTGLLRANREHRLEIEATGRREHRRQSLWSWLESLRHQYGPLVRATRIHEETVDPSTIQSAEIEEADAGPQPIKPSGRIPTIFPRISELLVQPEFSALAETDVPNDAFELELQAQHHQLAQSIDNWRTTLETGLVKLMPEETQPADTQSANFNLMTGTGKPIDSLAIQTRKLLRADAFFTRTSNHDRIHYPECFTSWIYDPAGLLYDDRAASVAKALLSALERPNATNLEMTAVGRVFLCKRCSHCTSLRTWAEIVGHYLEEGLHYETVAASRRFRRATDFTYIFVHDLDPTNSNELLSQVKSKTEVEPNSDASTYSCKVCIKGGIFKNFHGRDRMEGHIRSVHLVDDPELGTHYNMTRI